MVARAGLGTFKGHKCPRLNYRISSLFLSLKININETKIYTFLLKISFNTNGNQLYLTRFRKFINIKIAILVLLCLYTL